MRNEKVFYVNWIFIKDIPNRIFRQIINEYNDNKPVTSSRDTQEIFPSARMRKIKILKNILKKILFLIV